MKTINKFRKSASLVFTTMLCVVLICSCKKDKDEPGTNGEFNQKSMLINYADNLIIASYQNTSVALGELTSSVGIFAQSPTTQQLEELQQKWQTLYSEWIWASLYNFGPAGEQGIKKRLVEEIATFPVDSAAVNTRIRTLDTSFADFKRDARGLLAIEYLLFATQESNADLVAKFQNNPKRLYYLQALISKVERQLNEVLTQWNNGYRESFIDNTGTSVGSSVSMMYNEFVRSYEMLKNFKLGIPLGKKAGQTGVEPNKVEALYSANSLLFMEENLKAVESNWLGRNKSGDNGIGWKEYIASASGGEDLIASTQSQQANISEAHAAINSTSSLFNQLTSHTATLNNLYIEMQKQTRFYKSDMSSLLGISITFTDADGD